MEAGKTFVDECGCAQNPNIMAQLDSAEQVVFSCVVLKFNRWGMKQERCLLLTNMALYNLKKDSIQRKIGINLMKGITKSLKKDVKEFLVHVKDEYDYRFECESIDKITTIIEACKHTYWKVHGKNVPVYGVPDGLKEFGTSKKDISGGYQI